MDRERHTRAWPVVCFLPCLLVLYLTWPRDWEPATPLRSAASTGAVAGHVPAAAPQRASGRAHRAQAAPRSGSMPELAATWTGAGASGPVTAAVAPRFAGMVTGWNGADLELVDLALPPHGPLLYKEATGPPRTQAAMPDPEPRPATRPGVTHLPSVEAPSREGGLRTIGDAPAGKAALSHSQRAEPAWRNGWPEPVDLLERVEALADECETGPWALKTLRELDRLGGALAEGSRDEALSIIHRLDELAEAADKQADQLEDPFLATDLRRTMHALARRLVAWSHVLRSGGPQTVVHDRDQLDPQGLSAYLARVDKIPGHPDALKTWREYLELEPLRRALASSEEGDRHELQTAAWRTLQWLTAPGLTAEQRQFLAGKPFAGFDDELRRWASEPLDLGGVLEHLEQFERTGSPGDARQVAEDCLLLGLSPGSDQRELGRKLRTHYRNANLRIVLARDLLERMMPEREPEYQVVRDQVLGNVVRGRSVTSADVGVVLLPDPNRLRLALVVKGLVSSLTHSTTGPATFHNDSKSNYVAVRRVELGTSGITLHPAEVAVDADIRLRSLQTTLDGVPLLGGIVHGIAQSQHARMRPEMSREVKQKVAARAKELFEQETDARLREMDQKLKTRVLQPLETLCLGPTVVTSQTTEDRLTMRLRLAADDQLAGNTPRPRAPGDSLASCQIHESALNNMIERLMLDGGTFTLAEVRQRIAAVFNNPEMLEEDPGREDVKVTFAERDAIGARFRDGEVALTLSIARLQKSPHVWKDFQVSAYYRPELNGREAALVREGIVELRGGQALGSQIALRGIFNGIFSRNRPWKLTPDSFLTDPRFADLAVTQLVIDDGWIGLALGPHRDRPAPVVARRDAASAD